MKRFGRAGYYGTLSLIASLAAIVFYSIPNSDGPLRVSMFASFALAVLTLGEIVVEQSK